MPLEEVVVPDIGGAEDAEVIELLVAVGDEVAVEQSLIVLESDKASMEIPSTLAGTIVELMVAVGDQLAEGAPLIRVEVTEQAGEAAVAEAPQDNSDSGDAQPTAIDTPAEEAPAVAVAAEQSPPPVPAVAVPPTQHSEGEFYAGPAVRKLAREFGVQLTRVTGTGPLGRILKEDLHKFVQQSLDGGGAGAVAGAGIPVVPEVDFARFGDVVVEERSKLDKLTAANMHRSWLNVPHVTQFDEADITELEEFRAGLKAEAESRGTRLTPLPFLLKACAVALRDNPKLNSSLARSGEDIVYKHYIHIGMAVDTPAGLVVPVIRDVDKKTIWQLADEVSVMAEKARDRKLAPADMQGGCFTISSLGAIGGTGFTPIVNTPEVGILGVSRAAIKPLWDGAEFMPRKLLPLALSYDHRVVNGGDGGRFLSRIVSLLSDIRQLSM